MNPMTPRPIRSVSVIGAGSWGTALAALLAQKVEKITLWSHEKEVALGIQQHRKNPLFVSGFELPSNLMATTRLDQAAQADLLVMVVPTQFTRAILQQLSSLVRPETVFVSASKGIEIKTMTLISSMYEEIFGASGLQKTCFLSGPSFARDLLAGFPTAVVLAGQDEGLLERLQYFFSTAAFRTYRSSDVVGLELGGALKNVIALAAGISDGLGFGYSARAALITRGLAEMIRFGKSFGAREATFSGLSGLGDLMLTATSEASRNRTVGLRLGQGESLAQIQEGAREVAEGVGTTHAVFHMAQARGIEMPITRSVYEILYEARKPRSVVTQLMERDLKSESAE